MAGHGVILGDAYDELRALRRAHRHPGDHDAARDQRLPRVASAASRHAGHARRGARQPGHPAGRPASSAVGLRFDDRVTGNLAALRARGEDHPHRARPVRDRQERAGRRSAWWATRGTILRALLDAGAGAADCDGVAGGDRRLRAAARTRASAATSRPRAILRGASTTASGGRCTIVSDVGQHQMWVAKLFPLPAAQHPHHLRRARHHGLRRAGGDGRARWRGPTSRSGPSRATAASR